MFHVVLGPVQSLTVQEITADAIALFWSEQIESLCSTDEFVIDYALTNLGQCEEQIPEWKEFDVVTDTEVIITGLLPYSTYDIAIYTNNNYGLGESVRITNQTWQAGKNSHSPKQTFPFYVLVIEIHKIRFNQQFREMWFN